MQLLLPVNVMWISKIKYDHKTLERHTHDFYHMFYIRKGEGLMHVSGKDYEVCENEVYLCPPEIVHGLIAQSNVPLNVIEIKFTVEDLELTNVLNELQGRIKCKLQNLYLRLEELVSEALHKPKFYKEIVNIGFTRVLLELGRNIDTPFNSSLLDDICNKSQNHSMSNINEIKDIEGNDFVLRKILDYSNTKYAENITLDNLAKIGSVSPAHLNKLFKAAFDMSPIQYINNLRMDKAKELMMYSDFNISQISELVGFSSIHYFSRYFKSKENISPSEFRNSVKDNIYVYL